MGRIVFTALGSYGDLFPALAVARELRSRGHLAVFVTPPGFESVVMGEDFECHVAAHRAFANVQTTDPGAVRRLVAERLPVTLASALTALSDECRTADLLVAHPSQLAGPLAAKQAGLRWVLLSMFPGFVPSGYTVPEPHWLPALPTAAGRLVNRLTWRAYEFSLNHLAGDFISAAAVSLGLDPDDPEFRPGALSPLLNVLLSSPEYSPRQPDWPVSVRIVGHAEWDVPRGWRDPPGLKEFIAGGPPPAVVTTSTAGERDALAFFETAAEALKRSGRRGILLAGSEAERLVAKLGPSADLAVYPYVPLSHVVPHSALVVHHGGIGTALTTLRHGRPSVAVPAIHDQWYNAGRIEALGIGRVIPSRKLTIAGLADAIGQVDEEPGYRRRAAEIGSLVAQEKGARVAADEIEGVLGGR